MPSLLIELQWKEIGQLRVRSGTTKKTVRDAMKAMFRTLYQMGRADIIRDVKAQRISAMEVYERFRMGKLEQLPSADVMRTVEVAWTEWMKEKELKPKTRYDYDRALARISAFAGSGATLAALPGMLGAHRATSRGVHPRTFNKDRAAALSMLSSLVGERHALYVECWRIEPLKVPRLETNPQTLAEVNALAALLPAHHATTLYAYFLTGMRPEEMFEEEDNTWQVEADRIRIVGTKTSASVRTVPRIGLIVRPQSKRRAFAKALSKVSGGKVTPYDLRRSYSQLLELAKIPLFRQDYYMAHGPKDLGTLYKRAKECEQYLLEDAQAIEAIVSQPVALKVMK